MTRRLAKWDSDVASCLARATIVDDQDRRAGLPRLVSSMEDFHPRIAALEVAAASAGVPYTLL